MKRGWRAGALALVVLAVAPAFAGSQPGAPYWSVQLARVAGRANAVDALRPLRDAPYARAEKRESGYLIRVGAWPTREEAEASASGFRARYGKAVKVLHLEHPVDWVIPSGGTIPVGTIEPAPRVPVAPAPAPAAAAAPSATPAPNAIAAEPSKPWSWKPLGYPGDTWGRVSEDLSGKTGVGISTFVNQGIDWFVLPGDLTFNTYAEYRYSKRNKDNRYFDADGPAIGMQLSRAPFHLGLEHFWERDSQLDSHRGNADRAYLGWYTDWYKYMRRHGGDEGYQILGLAGSTWGKVNQDFSNGTGTAISGFVNEGIDWFQLPWDTVFNTFVEIRYGFRTKDNLYFDGFGPAIGAELQRAPFHLGMDYYWQRYTRLHETDPSWRLYLTWYYNWDLKDPFRNPFE